MLASFLEKYTLYIKYERDLNINTLQSYINDINKYSLYLQSKGVKDLNIVTKTHIIQYLIELESEGLASSTIARNLSSLKSYYEFLRNKGYVSNNPTIGLKAPKVIKKSPDILTKIEIELLLQQPDLGSFKGVRDKAMIEVIYSTGLGVNEVIDLNIGDLDLELGTLRVESPEGSRVLPIGSYAQGALKLYLKNLRKLEDTSPLFINSRGSRITRQGFWKNLKEYEEKSGINKSITPQILRQSFAVHMIENGAEIKVVQKMLGHSDLSTTQVYVPTRESSSIREVHRKSHPRA